MGLSFDILTCTNSGSIAGCSQIPFSKAAGEQEPEAYPRGYVEDSCELRTPLAEFFSILHEVPFMIHIRPATEADFSALLQVQQAAFGEYASVYKVSGWTTETLDSLKEDAREKHIFVAEADGELIGSVRFWNVAGVCVIRLLSVSPAHHTQGVGKTLIREVERVAIDSHKFYAC